MRIIEIEPNEASVICEHCGTTLCYFKEEKEIEYSEWYEVREGLERRIKRYYIICHICRKKIYRASVPQVRKKGSKMYDND